MMKLRKQKELEKPKISKVPASKDAYEIKDSEALGKKDAKKFHSITAQTLYLTNRTRLATKLATHFYCTRVQSPTKDNENYLKKLLGYLVKN